MLKFDALRYSGYVQEEEMPKPSSEALEDIINKPKHYNQGKYQPINVIEDWKLNYHLGNVLKYISRARHKGNEIQDLEKAAWYLARYIEIKKEE